MAEARPLLFQRRICGKDRAFTDETVRTMLDQALLDTGLTDITGAPLRYTPHDFRRLFITDAILNGLPPHIAQVIAGHQDINVTLGYKAVPRRGNSGAHGLPGPPPVPSPERGIPRPHRRGMAGVPRPLRAPQSLHRRMRPRVRHPLHTRTRLLL
ncbi:tyrosine-type recombinase/integrase [Streptomyces sp. NPDC056708]